MSVNDNNRNGSEVPTTVEESTEPVPSQEPSQTQ